MDGRRSRRRAPAACALLLALAACAARPAAGPPALDPGPLGSGVEDPYGSVVPAAAPTFTDGMVLLRLQGDRPATIESVSVDADGLELVGAQVSGAGRRVAAVQYQPSWPPGARFGPHRAEAVGAVVRPRSEDPMGTELLLGYRILPGATGAQRSVTVRYRVDGRAYAWTTPYALVVCPVGVAQEECGPR